MQKDLFESADVQYGDYKGTVAVDITDMHGLAEYLGFDPLRDLILRVDITNYGGLQRIQAFITDLEDGNMQDILDKAKRGEAIHVRQVEVMEWSPDGHSDTNPPRLTQFPIKSISELIEHAFKRLHITLIANPDYFPIHTKLEFDEEQDI